MNVIQTAYVAGTRLNLPVLWLIAMVVFLIVEGIRRKPVPRDKEALVHAIGLVAFMGLFVLLTFHDIMRIIHG